MKKRNKFKVGPDAYKRIVAMARDLPEMQKLDKNNNPIFFATAKRVLGEDLPLGTKVEGKGVDPKALYIQKGRKPLLINHTVMLVEAYQEFGEAGLNKYVDYVNLIASKGKQKGNGERN